MKNLKAQNLQINRKYCIIYCNTWYEAKLKVISTLYDFDQYVFNTRLGDIYLYYSPTRSKWQWQEPLIFEDRFEAVLQLGILLFQGKPVRRTPYSQEKHIDLCLKLIPEKMI